MVLFRKLLGWNGRIPTVIGLLLWLQAERHALRQDVARAKSQLAEAHTASQAAQAAAHTSTEGLATLEKALLTARSAVFASSLQKMHV